MTHKVEISTSQAGTTSWLLRIRFEFASCTSPEHPRKLYKSLAAMSHRRKSTMTRPPTLSPNFQILATFQKAEISIAEAVFWKSISDVRKAITLFAIQYNLGMGLLRRLLDLVDLQSNRKENESPSMKQKAVSGSLF